MPRNKPQIEFKGFCQVYLDEKDASVLESSSPSLLEQYEWLEKTCHAGYKFTTSTDGLSAPIKVTMMDVDITRSSCGWMLSAEGADMVDAISAIMYKHTVKMGSDWRPFCTTAREVKRFR